MPQFFSLCLTLIHPACSNLTSTRAEPGLGVRSVAKSLPSQPPGLIPNTARKRCLELFSPASNSFPGVGKIFLHRSQEYPLFFSLVILVCVPSLHDLIRYLYIENCFMSSVCDNIFQIVALGHYRKRASMLKIHF